MIILALLALALSASVDDQWTQFLQHHNRKYSAEEMPQKFKTFKANLERIEQLNERSKHATFATNKFADLTPEEFASKRLMPKIGGDVLARCCLANGITAPMDYTPQEIASLPDSWDWRTQGGKGGKGIVTPVKDQGDCGSCWTFSTTGNIESQYALKGNPLTQFSEQMLVDCSTGCSMEPPYGKVCNQGCNGGWQWNAFQDIMAWGGVQTETEYPYQGATYECRMNSSLLMAKILNYTCLSNPGPVDELQLQAHIYKNGPVSIALDATLLQFYYGGIVDPFFPSLECDPTQLDHALLIVGWGQERNWIGEMTPYWIVKNSWGADWGDSGYFLIARNYNMCGIANAVSSSIMS